MNDSSSSAESRTEGGGSEIGTLPAVDLVGAGLLPALPAAFAKGEALELLGPLRFLEAGSVPARIDHQPDRSVLAEGLAVANAGYGHPSAQAQAARLADPKTEVVVTGQQTGLFGGPLYTLSKAIAATLWVERLEAAGRRAVAVFWMATEDHDFREVSRAGFPASSGLLDLDLGADPAPLMPIGMRALGPNVERALDELRASVPGQRFGAWLDRLATWYRRDARFGEAFARLMADLLGERCPLLLDAMLPAVKAVEQPWLAAIHEQHEQLDAAYAERDREIQAAGFDLQVSPQPGSSPLFYLHGAERRRLEPRGDTITLRGVEGFEQSAEWMAEVLRDNPAVVSPGVLARPAVQDAILGTCLQILGPGEVSYMPQVAPIYEVLGIAAPYISIRPQALALGEHQLGKLDSIGLALAALIEPGLDLDRALGGGEADALVAEARTDISERLDQLGSRALEIDVSLGGPLKKTRDRIDGALAAFSAKAVQAAGRRDLVRRQRAQALRDACLPGGSPQERVVSSAYFPGKYGDRFVGALFDQLSLDWRRLSVVRL